MQPQTIESARRAFHDLSVEYADLDAKLIDVTARRDGIAARHEDVGKRRDEARRHLVALHAAESPAAPASAVVHNKLNGAVSA